MQSSIFLIENIAFSAFLNSGCDYEKWTSAKIKILLYIPSIRKNTVYIFFLNYVFIVYDALSLKSFLCIRLNHLS